MPDRPKASDIDDVDMLMCIAHYSDRNPASWVMTWDLFPAFPLMPPKVVLAKCRQLIKRKLIDGCPCGCRGDFELTREGAAWLANH